MHSQDDCHVEPTQSESLDENEEAPAPPLLKGPEDTLYNQYLSGELSINDLMKKLYSSSKADETKKTHRARPRSSSKSKNRRLPEDIGQLSDEPGMLNTFHESFSRPSK